MHITGADMLTSRLEAFSDGVIAVAITLLVFDLKVPVVTPRGLGHPLAHRWPSYLAYGISFVSIGIMWVNHHTLFDKVTTVDRTLLFANLGLLLGIATLPFSTSVAAAWLRTGSNARIGVVLYCATLLVVSSVFTLLWIYLGRHPDLLDEHHRAALEVSVRRSAVGPVAYAIATALAFVTPVPAFAVCGLIALYFVLPLRRVPMDDEGA
jgi:uncharacterized membrane protein